MIETLYIDNDNLLIVDLVYDVVAAAYVNGASVTCTLKDNDGDTVVGQAWPLTLDYVAGSNGKYQGILDDGLILLADKQYTAEITIDAGSDLIANIKKDLFASCRT